MKKIGIVGGGSVGLSYAGFLAGAAEVVLKVRRQEQADAINAHGVTLVHRAGEGGSQTFQNIHATTDASELSSCEGIIVTVKSYDTERVAEELSAVLSQSAEVLTLQNGLQALQILKEKLTYPQRVFAGVTYVGAVRNDDTTVSEGKLFTTVIDDKAQVLGEVFERSLYGVTRSQYIAQDIWEKLILNVGQNALSAVTNRHLGQLLESTECVEIADQLLREFEAVAVAEDVKFTGSLLEKLKQNWKGSVFYPSMWQDIYSGRRTEVDAINGAIGRLGREHGIATPYNDMITLLVKALEDPAN